MGPTLDKFGFGLSIVFVLLYWQLFNDADQNNLAHRITWMNINTTVGIAYTVTIFLTEVLVFTHLIFSSNNKTSFILLRSIGWLLILVGYVLFIYLNQGTDGWELLNKRGGGFNRFE